MMTVKNKFKLRRYIWLAVPLVVSFFLYWGLSSELDFTNINPKINNIGGIIIPDSIFYYQIIDESNPLLSVYLSGIKNTIGPSTIWYLVRYQWLASIGVNILCIIFSIYFFIKTCHLLKVPNKSINRSAIIFCLLPIHSIYSLGVLKEAPSLLIVSLFIFSIVSRYKMGAIVSLILVLGFRYQLLVPMFLVLIAQMIGLNKLKHIWLLFFFSTGILFPLFMGVPLLGQEGTAIYRDTAEQSIGLGASVEYVRDNLPGISLLAIVVRVLIFILEPLTFFIKYPSFTIDGYFQLYPFFSAISFVFLAKYFARYFYYFICSFVLTGAKQTQNNLLYISYFFFFPVAGFSFIHFRYLYPFTLLIILCVIVSDAERITNAANKLDSNLS